MIKQENNKLIARNYGIPSLSIHLVGFINIWLLLGEVLLRGATKMADQPPHPDSKGDTGTRPDRRSTSYPGMPRWVKVFGIIVIVLVVVVIIILASGHTSPAPHGP